MQNIASRVESINADGLIMIAESWLRKSLDSEPYVEALNLIGINKAGERFNLSSRFYRDTNENISFDSNIEGRSEGGIVQPVIDMWESQNT